MTNIIAEFEAGRGKRGAQRTVQWVEKGDFIQLRVLKNDNISTKINWDKQIINDLFHSLADVQEEVAESDTKNVIPDKASPQEKLDMINQLLGSMNQHELEQLKTQDNSQQINTELLGDIARTPNPKKDSEKIKEDVLQLIYEEYGFDWFTMPEFREVYDVNYQKGQAYRWLQKMHDRYINKDKIPEEEKEGYVQYRYKLNSNSKKIIQEYGAFDTKEYPVYRKKCKEYKQG